jgi:hypothetical protein
LEHGTELVAEAAELRSVDRGQPLELLRTGRGQQKSLTAPIFAIDLPPYESSLGRPVDELDGGVVLQLQLLGEIADRGRSAAGETADREKQLMLVGRDALCTGRILGEPHEDAKGVPEVSQGAVVAIAKHRFGDYLVSRYFRNGG